MDLRKINKEIVLITIIIEMFTLMGYFAKADKLSPIYFYTMTMMLE